MKPLLVYYSSESLNTQRFVGRLNFEAVRIPLSPNDPQPEPDRPFVLFCPTFADDAGQGAVPKQVISFLNNPRNRKQIIGVVASGNRNFGKYYAYAGDVIASKCKVPCLYKYELAGTMEDAERVKEGLEKIWQKL